MLTVILSGDEKERARLLGIELSSAKKEKRNVVRFDDTSFNLHEAEKYFGNSDLFSLQYSVVFDRVLSVALAHDFFFGSLPLFVSSENTFLFLEEKLSAEEIRKIEKLGGKVLVEKSKQIKPKETFNIFSLGDALGEKDKRKLWVLYQKALREGKSPEEISGTLFWMLKSMLLVEKGGGSTLNPFVKSKAARFLKNYSGDSLSKLTFEFVKEYHESRRGGLSLEERIERVILSL